MVQMQHDISQNARYVHQDAKMATPTMEKQNYTYATKTSNDQLKRQTHSKLSSQAGKGCLVKWFGEDIGKLVLGGYMG